MSRDRDSQINQLAPEGPGSFGWAEHQAELRGEIDYGSEEDHQDSWTPPDPESTLKQVIGAYAPSGVDSETAQFAASRSEIDATEHFRRANIDGSIGTHSVFGTVEPVKLGTAWHSPNQTTPFFQDSLISNICSGEWTEQSHPENDRLVSIAVGADGKVSRDPADTVAYSIELNAIGYQGRGVAIFPSTRAQAEVIHRAVASILLEGSTWKEAEAFILRISRELGIKARQYEEQ